jgi:hypothetical protein
MYGSPVLEYLVAERLAEARAGASRRALLVSLRPAREPLGTRVGRSLLAAARRALALGRALAGGRAHSPVASARRGDRAPVGSQPRIPGVATRGDHRAA